MLGEPKQLAKLCVHYLSLVVPSPQRLLSCIKNKFYFLACFTRRDIN